MTWVLVASALEYDSVEIEVQCIRSHTVCNEIFSPIVETSVHNIQQLIVFDSRVWKTNTRHPATSSVECSQPKTQLDLLTEKEKNTAQNSNFVRSIIHLYHVHVGP